MDFNSHKPIYIQIYDSICEKILSGVFIPEERIPSVREYASSVGVNPNTIMRTYERLTNDNIIFNKRGVGYFVSSEAIEIIKKNARETFIKEELPEILKKVELLGLDLSALIKNK